METTTATVPALRRNSAGWFYIHWSEKDENGVWRSQRRSTRTKDQQDAIAQLRKHLASAATPGAPMVSPTTVGELIDQYELGANLRGVKLTQLMALRPIRAAWGDKLPQDLDTKAVARYVSERTVHGLWTKRAEPVAPSTVRRELGALTSALRWCLKKRLLLETELPDLDLPPAGAPREVFLTESEATDLCRRALDFDQANGTQLWLFCSIAIDMCARAHAIETLPWGRVDFERNMIDFRDPNLPPTKKRREVLPMSDAVEAILRLRHDSSDEELPPLPTDLVVGPVPHHVWNKFIETTPFKDRGLTRHDLRRTGASLMIARGVELLKVAKMLGDHPQTVLKHYARFAPDYLADVHKPASS